VDNKGSRIKYNLISSLVCQIVIISLSFILPSLYIRIFGSEGHGVLSLVKDVFAYMCILEAGVGLATTQALYKRLGNNDHNGANSVLSATDRYYKKTGVLYAAIILVVAVIYSYLRPLPEGIDGHTMFALFMLNAIPSLFRFFIQMKYTILMEADGRKYVINNSETVVQLLSGIGKLAVLFLTDNILYIQLVYCVIALFQLAYLYFYAKRRYKWLDLKTKPDFEAVSQKDSVLVHKLSGMVFNNTDLILITSICDYGATSVYAVYRMFFATMQGFITSIASSFSFALGQLFHTDREKFDKMFNAYETFYITVSYIVYTLMGVFLLPLIQIYTTDNGEVNYTNVPLMLLFVLMNLISESKLPINGIIEYSGDFKNTRSHAIWEMIINLSVSVVALKCLGICGAIIGTIAALVYRCIVTIHYSNVKILKRSQMCTYKIIIVNAMVFALVMAIFFVDAFSNVSFGKLLIYGVLNSAWIVPLYILVNFIFNRKAFKTVFELYMEKKKQ